MKPSPPLREDLYAVGAAVLLFAVAAVVGHAMENSFETLRLHWPPMYARFRPHIGPGTPAALTVAGLVIGYGPEAARRLGWRALLWTCWGGSMAWVWSLALIDGWHHGVAGRLTTKYEYLRSVGEVQDVGATLREFTSRILMDAPDNWPAHVAGHPPGALLTFVGLDRIGLGGGAWGAAFCVTVGASAAVAVLVTVRALGDEPTARRAAPFLVLAPAAVWMGVSADGYFTGVSAWALALLALAATRRVRLPWPAALGSGVLFGWTVYLSYGLTLLVLVAAAVLFAARQRGDALRHTAQPVLGVVLGVLPFVVVFTAAGFCWFEGYTTLFERYYQGAAKVRPYEYFVWANLAAQVVVVGPATVAGLRQAAGVRHGALVILVAGAVCAMLVADLSGMSKAETERIWLPFAVWLLPAAALLPERHHRWWLTSQAVIALTVNHLLDTGW